MRECTSPIRRSSLMRMQARRGVKKPALGASPKRGCYLMRGAKIPARGTRLTIVSPSSYNLQKRGGMRSSVAFLIYHFFAARGRSASALYILPFLPRCLCSAAFLPECLLFFPHTRLYLFMPTAFLSPLSVPGICFCSSFLSVFLRAVSKKPILHILFLRSDPRRSGAFA